MIRISEKRADKLLAAIEKSKKVPFHKFLYALGIRHVGIDTAKRLANNEGFTRWFRSRFDIPICGS